MQVDAELVCASRVRLRRQQRPVGMRLCACVCVGGEVSRRYGAHLAQNQGLLRFGVVGEKLERGQRILRRGGR